MSEADNSSPADGVDAKELPTAAPHPEEMKATTTVSFGEWATITTTARATPAGLMCAAVLAAAIMIPLATVLRRR